MAVAKLDHLVGPLDELGRTRDSKDPDSLGGISCGDLVAHHLDCRRWWADEGDALLGDGFGEVGVFRKESVPRMNGVGTASFNGIEY